MLKLRGREAWERLNSFTESPSTPCYIYDLDRVEANARSYIELSQGRAQVLFASMANPRPDIFRAVSRAGVGAFVNSWEHLQGATAAGLGPERILFAGSGHDAELQNQIALNGCMYVADSLAQLSSYLECDPRGPVGVRVNVGSLLDLDPASDPAPRLGLAVEEVLQSSQVRTHGEILHVYVGTNLDTTELHVAALERLCLLARQLPTVRMIDLGGGFSESPRDIGHDHGWAVVLDRWQALSQSLGRSLQLTIEPGRSIVKSAGALFARVVDVKERNGKRFVVVNTSSTWYPRKLVHDANDHHVTTVTDRGSGTEWAVICGASTFSKDILVEGQLPRMELGDVVLFAGAGAYCEAMHLDFLGMPRPTVWHIHEGSVRAPMSSHGPHRAPQAVR